MNYLFSIVLIFFDTLYCGSGEQLHNVQPNNETVPNQQVSRSVKLNYVFDDNTTVAFEIQTIPSTVNEANIVTSITTKESETTNKTVENEQISSGENKYQNLEERHKVINNKAWQSDEQYHITKQITSFLNTSKLMNDMKQSQTLRLFTDKYKESYKVNSDKYVDRRYSIKVESLILEPKTLKTTDITEKTEPNLSEYVNFEVVDSHMSKDNENKTAFDGNKLSNSSLERFLQNRGSIQHDVTKKTEIISVESKVSIEGTKETQDAEQNDFSNKSFYNFLRSSRKEPSIIKMQFSTYNDAPNIRNGMVDSTIRKVRTTTKKKLWSSKTDSHDYNTDNWNPNLRSSIKTQYTKPYNVRAVNKKPRFRDRKLKNRKHSPKKNYEDSFEEDNAKFLSKNVDISNSQYSLENIDGPPTKYIRNENPPVNNNVNIFLKAEMDSDTATKKKYIKNDFPIDDKSVENLRTIDYETETMADTNIYDELKTELTQQYETKAVTKPKNPTSNISSNRMKQRTYEKSTMKDAAKWKKLIYSSSYSDEEDVLVQNINKAMKKRKKYLDF